MDLPELLQASTKWLAWTGLGLTGATLISFLVKWGPKFRLIGASIFTFLLAGSCWAFAESYNPPVVVEGAKYAPIVYDNGYDLVVAQAPIDFPEEAIQPTIEQIAGNLKGGRRSGAKVHVRIRRVEPTGSGISTPKILGEVIRDLSNGTTQSIPREANE